MAKKPLQTLYESLRASNYDVPDNYGSFERTLTAPGTEGVRNRQTLYKALRDNNYDVPDTYESFSRTLFSPVKPTGGTASTGQSMLPADVEERRMRTRNKRETHPLNKSRARQRLQAQQQAIEAQQKRWEQDNKRFKEDIARREQRLPGGMDRFEERAKEQLATGEAAPVPLAPNDEVVRGDIAFNPSTGRMEQTYTTPEGGTFFDRDAAQFDHSLQNMPDDEIEMLEREQELIGMGILRRGRELDEEYENQSWWDRFLAGLGTDPEMGPGPRERMAEDDEELQSLLTAWRKNRNALRILYDERNNDMNSFWHNFGTTVANGYTFTGGRAELHDAQAILNSSKRMDEIQRKMQAGEKLSNVENAALSLANNTAWDNAIQAMYGDDYGAWATAGGAAVQSLEMMPEFIAGMPVLKGMGTAAIKLLTRNAAKGFGRFMLKGLGMTLGTMAGGAIMANTIQAERTLGKAAGKAAGSWWFGDDGEFMLGHYDGDQFVSGGESLAAALFHAEQEAIPEAASEGAGEFLPGIGQVLSKIGLSRIAKPLASLSGKGWYKTYQNMLRAAGWHGVGGEALEEYVGTLDGLIMGDVEGVKRLADPRTHFDIWLSCATLGPLLNAPVVLGSSMRGVYSPVAYHKLKAAVTRQDKIASFRLTEDRWAPWRDRIDSTPNEQMADLMVEIRDDQDLAPQEKKAIFDYVKALQGYRGWNLGEYIFGKDAEEDGEGKSEQEQQQSQEYSNGYETVTPEERRAAKDRLDVARARLGEHRFVAETLDGMSIEEVTDLLNLDTIEDEDRAALQEYINARTAYDGMLQRVNDDIDDEVAVANEAIDQRIAPEDQGGDGMIHPAVLKGGREVFIISGNVATMADNSIDIENSDGMIIVRDAEGNEDTISPDNIQSLGEVIDPAQQRQDAEQMIIDEQGQAAAAQIEGQLPFNVGDQYTISYQGEPHTYQVVQADENNVAVLVDGAQEPVVLTRQQLQQMADEERAEQIQAQAAAADAVEEEPAAVEPEQPVEAPAVEETPAAPVAPEGNPTAAMPMDDQGEPAWDQVEPERGHQFLYQESGWPQAMADNFVQKRIDDAEKALTKAQEAGQKLIDNPKPTFSAQQQAVAENTAAQQAAQSALDYWKGVQGIQAQATAPVVEETAPVVETPAEQEPTEQTATEPAVPVTPEANEPVEETPAVEEEQHEQPVEETPAPVAENEMQPVEVEQPAAENAPQSEETAEQPAEEETPEKTDIELLQEEFEDELSRDDIKVEVLPETFEESSAEMTVNVTVDGQATNIWFVVGEGNTVDEHWKRISEPFPEMSWQEVDDLAEEYNQAVGRTVCDANDEAKRINFKDIEEAIAFEKWMQEREQPGPLQELERLFDDITLAASLNDMNAEIIPESVEVTEDGDIQGRLRIAGEDTDIWVAKSDKGIYDYEEGARVFVMVDPSRDVDIEKLAADYNKEFHKHYPNEPDACKVAEEGDRIDFDDLEDAYQFYIEQPEHAQRVEALKAEAEARAKARNAEDIKYSVESQGEVPTGNKQKKFDIAEANNSGDPNEYVIYQGVYHDPSGYAVSTDGHILVADKRAYDEKNKGKLIASKRVKKAREVKNNPAVTEPVEKGQPIPIERYPNWKSVKAGKEGTETAKVDFKKFADWVAGVEVRMKEQWQQWKDEHPDEKMSFNSWRDHSRIQIMTPDGRVRWFKFNDMQVFARAAADQGSKTLRFYPNNSDLALQAESKNGFVLMMPLHIGSDYERLVDNPYRIEGGLNIDKNGSVFTYDMTMPGKTSTGRVELNYESGKDAESRAYIEEVMERDGWDEEAKSEFRKILDDAADLVSRMAQGFTRLREWNNKKLTDEQGNYNPLWRVWDKAVGWIPNRSSFKKNGEYPYNIDLGALCTKREAFDAVVRYIKEQGWGQNLGPTQIEALKSLLREHGFLTACDICFNETKRARALDYGNAVAYYWNAVRQAVGIDDDLPVGTPRELTDEQMKILTALAAPKNGKAFSKYIPKAVRRTYETYTNTKGERKTREADKGLTPTMTAKVAKLFLQDPSLMGRFEGTTLLSTDSVDALVRQHPQTDIAEFIAGAWGSATPKPNEGFNIYDPLSWKQAYDKKRQRPAMDWFFNLGGFRAQSFSDYHPIFFYDYVQMFTDLAIRRLPIHIYTKVPALIKLFGGTGAKFNMSLVPEVVQGVDPEHLGLKPDGNGGWELAWHEDSFPVDEAFALRQDPRFNGNVGTIAVGISDAHIRMLLDDPRIDMVIPYHKSGMPKSVQIKTGLNNATDYTADQQTKGKKKGLKDFSFNEALRRLGDPRKAADEYLAWCKQNKCTPKFPQFADHPNYYKVLEDFRCIDNEGNYSPQQPVQVSFFDDVEQRLSESLEDRTMQEGLDTAIRGNDAITEGIKKIMSKPRLDGKIRDMMLARLKQVLGKDNVASLKQEDFFEELQKVYTDQMGAERAQQQVEVLRTSGGIVYGFAVGDRIVLNENYFNAETPMHEFTHVWVKVARLANPQMWAEGKELLKQTKEWQEVMSDEFYRDIQGDEDAVASEVLARIVGQDAARQINEMFAPEDKPQERPGIYNKIKQWVNKFLDGVRSLFDSKANGLTYDELVRMPMKALFDDAEAARFMETLQQVNEEDVDLSSQGSVPTFYSNAAKAVENVKQNKATAEQWKAMLTKQGGIKAGEDKWMGLSTWLDEHKGETLTKDEVAQFVADNGIEMEETHYSEYLGDAGQERLDELRAEYADVVAHVDDIYKEKAERFSKYCNSMEERYGEDWLDKMTLQERMTYNVLAREQEQADPQINDRNDIAFLEMIDRYGDDFGTAFEPNVDLDGNPTLMPTLDYYDNINDAARSFLGVGENTDELINQTRSRYTTEGLENKREIAFVVPGIEPYQENDEIHFGPENQGRAIMWVRFGETTDTDGNRVLVIDEIQSNRHQDAREKGYRSNEDYKNLQSFRAKLSKEHPEGWSVDNESARKSGLYILSKEEHEELMRLNSKAYGGENRDGIPAAPFEKNWHEVAMKRMLRLAAEEGFDKVAWTTGAQQADRYDLRKVIGSVSYTKNSDGTYNIVCYKTTPEAGEYTYADDGLTENQLRETIGAGLTEKIVNGEGDQFGSSRRVIRLDENTSISGGEGMSAFYDKMLPSFMNKYGKRWGVKVGEVTLDTPGKEVMHSVDVTPEMRHSVMTEGQPLFQIKGVNKSEERTLMGMHNITAEKLRSALKLGGLANPSMAVINTEVGGFTNFGEISLIPSADLIASRTGDNAGTWGADAYSPRFPETHRRLGKGGDKKLSKWVKGLKMRQEMEYNTEEQFNDYYNGFNIRDNALVYPFLHEKGLSGEVDYYTHMNVDQRLEDDLREVNGDQWALLKRFDEDEEYKKKLTDIVVGDELKKINKKEGETFQEYRDRRREMAKQIRDGLTGEDGYINRNLAEDLLWGQARAYRENGKFSESRTRDNAEQYIRDHGMEEEYQQYFEQKMQELGAETQIYAGSDSQGRSKFKAADLDQVSKQMKKQGRAGGEGGIFEDSPGAIRAKLLTPMKTLDQIRKQKGRIVDHEQFEKAREDYQNELREYADTYARGSMGALADILTSRNMQATARQYNIDLDADAVADLNGFKDRVRALPTEYFETKFERPVMLDEFKKAVIPDNLPLDLYGALQRSGLEIVQYPAGDTAARERVTLDAVKDDEDIRFRDDDEGVDELGDPNNAVLFRELDNDEDAELIERLENGPHITTYSTKIKSGDGYVPPMSSKDNETGEMRAPEHEQKWNESEERPDLAKQDKKTGKWKFDLKKSNDKDVNGVLYNPYNHSGSGMLNDQFSEAQDRDDLVVVEQVVPQSEETDKYKAEKANDPTGWKAWKAGPITAKMTGTRKVFLSRWHKITRVVPWNEVADAVAKDLGNQFDVLPTNPFPPQLRAELEKKGYKFIKTDNKCVIQEGEYKGATWSERYYDVYPDRAKSKDKREKGARAKAVKEQNASEASRMRSILEDGGTLRVYQREGMGWQNVDEVNLREDEGEWVFNRTIPGRFESRDAALDALLAYSQREGLQAHAEPGGSAYTLRRRLPNGKKWRVEGVPGEFDTQFGAVDNARNFLQGHVFEVAEDGNSIEVLGAGSNLDNMLTGRGEAATQETATDAAPMTAKQRKAEERARKWRERTVANGRRRVEELGQRLGVKVTIVDDMSEQQREGMSKKKRRAKGWYDVRTGEVFINLGNHKTVSDIEATFLHEVVAHKGLRRLFGEEFNTFLHNVYYNVDASIREEINRLMAKNNWDYREATEEYLAKLAQQMNFERPEKYVKAWETVARLFRTLLQKMGLGNGMNLKDSDLQGILFESYHNMEKEGVAGLAESVEFRDWMEREANRRVVNATYQGNTNDTGAAAENSDSEYLDAVEKSLDKNLSVEEHRAAVEDIQRMLGKAFMDKMGTELVKEDGMPLTMWHTTPNEFTVFDKDRLGENTDLNASNEDYAKTAHVGFWTNTNWNLHDKMGFSIGSNSMPLFVVAKNPLRFNSLSELATELSNYTSGEDFAEKKKNEGYDSVILNDEEFGGVSCIVFDSNQLKSAALRTYDNDGNLIPLSERFNPEKEDIRFRDDDDTIDDYNHEVNTLGRVINVAGRDVKPRVTRFNFQEAFQDAILSVKKLQQVVCKKYGLKSLPSKEDAWTYENRLQSINMRERKHFINEIYEKMMKVHDKLIKNGATVDEINEYVICKHGLERNKVFAQRDANAEANEIARNGGVPDMQQLLDKYRQRDYSGLTAITGLDDIADIEAEAQRRVDAFEQKHGTLCNELWGRINDATKWTLRRSYECGMMSAQTYIKVRDMFQWYVPLRGFNETTAEDVYDYMMGDRGAFNGTLRTAEGRTSLADDPFATIGNMGESAIVQGNRNKLKQRLWNMATQHPTDVCQVRDMWVVQDAQGNWIADFPDIPEDADADTIAQILEDHETAMTDLENRGLAKRVRNDLDVGYRIDQRNVPEHAVVVMMNGDRHVVYINGNPRAAQAINGNLSSDKGSKNAIRKLIDFIFKDTRRYYSSVITSYNINFSGANFVRDLPHAYAMTFTKYGFARATRYIAKSFQVIPWVIKNQLGVSGNSRMDQLFHEFVNYGGVTGYAHINDVDAWKADNRRRLARLNALGRATVGTTKAIKAVIEAIGWFSETLELIPRFTTYCASRDAGMDIQQSIKEAKDITTNFNKKGTEMTPGVWGAVANTLRYTKMFFNPIVQGMYQWFDVAKDSKAAKARLAGLMLWMPAMGAMIPYLNQFLLAALGGDDDDDYFLQNEFTRRQNMLIFTGKGYVKIPIAPVFRELYGMGETVATRACGRIDDLKMATDFVDQLRTVFSLEGQSNYREWSIARAVAPEQYAPIVDIMNNENFTGKQLWYESDWTKSKPEYTKAKESTWSPLVNISRTINGWLGGDEDVKADQSGKWLNPVVWQHLITNYGGGFAQVLGDVTSSASNMLEGKSTDVSQWPIAKRFYTEPTAERANWARYGLFKQYETEYNKAKDKYAALKKRGVSAMEMAKEIDNFAQRHPRAASIYAAWNGGIKGADYVQRMKKLREEGNDDEYWALVKEAVGKADGAMRKGYAKAWEEERVGRPESMSDDELYKRFDDARTDSLRAIYSREIATRNGIRDALGKAPSSNWKEETKAYWETYKELRKSSDILEDAKAAKILDDDEKKYLKEIRQGLGQGDDDDAIMEEHRQERQRMLKEHGEQ